MDVELHLFDKAFAWVGQVAEYDNLRATRAHLAVSDAEFTVPSDLDVRAGLSAPAARVVLLADGEQFVGGLVDVSGSFAGGADVACQVTDDYDLLGRILGWSVPGAALSAQAQAYWRSSPTRRPAESAFKAALSANVARLGLPITVAPDLGRGATIDLSYRFHPLTDRFEEHLRRAGIGVTVTLVEGQGWLVDCYAATVHDEPLTASDGVIVGGSWSRTRPTASRVVGAAQGEGENRTFYGPVIDTAREATYGFCGEVIVDARDTADGATVLARLNEALAEHGPRVSVDMELTETADFTYGPYRVGDRVAVEYDPAVPPTVDTLTEATLVHSTAVPEPEVSFQLGERTDDESVTSWRAVAAVAAGVRDLTVR